MKILLTGNIFHDYESDFYDALIESGHEVDILFSNIHGPFHPFHIPTIPKWVKYGLLPYKLKINYFRDKATENYNLKVKTLIAKNNYDLLLIINAKTLWPETIAQYKGPKVLWFFDSLTRYTEVLEKAMIFDYIFVFEPTDVAVVKEKFNKDAYFLATGFNPAIFYKTNQSKRLDFSFVGTCYPKRDEYLAELKGVSDNLELYGDFYRSDNEYIKKHIKKMLIPRKSTNNLFNDTRININIHHSQSKEGLSPRTFEIIGAGGFQMVERQKIAVELFDEDKDICFYDSKEEFVDKAKYYLANESLREQISTRVYEKALRMHTWKHRFEYMFKKVFS